MVGPNGFDAGAGRGFVSGGDGDRGGGGSSSSSGALVRLAFE